MKLVLIFCFGFTSFISGDAILNDPSRFPVPPYSKKSLFYVHRSTNANTVVYEANFVNENSMDAKNPVNVYWIRYGEKGQQRSLNYLERNFAYGVKCSPIKDPRYSVEFVASKDKKFETYIDSEGQAWALMKINGRLSRLKKIFVQVAEDGWWPSIDYVEFFGVDVETGKPAYEKMDIE